MYLLLTRTSKGCLGQLCTPHFDGHPTGHLATAFRPQVPAADKSGVTPTLVTHLSSRTLYAAPWEAYECHNLQAAIANRAHLNSVRHRLK